MIEGVVSASTAYDSVRRARSNRPPPCHSRGRSTTEIHGFADDGFGPVVNAFAANFADGTEVGAACAVVRDGRPVLDLHAGLVDRATGRPWTAETLTTVFSISNGLLTLCAYLANQQGLLDFDAPVVSVWPEFGAHGKQGIALRDPFSHRAGLIYLDEDLTFDQVAEWTPVIRAIEHQGPLWTPGTTFANHALTFGWLPGEVRRRVTGKRPGALLRTSLAGPLSVDAWVDLREAEEVRVAHLEPLLPSTDPTTTAWLEKPMSMPNAFRPITLGGAFPLLFAGVNPNDFNSRAMHAIEVPAANGTLSAPGVAKIYAAAVSEVDGPRLLTDESIADADAHLGFAYVNNQMGGVVDGRANRLTHALRSCLGP